MQTHLSTLCFLYRHLGEMLEPSLIQLHADLQEIPMGNLRLQVLPSTILTCERRCCLHYQRTTFRHLKGEIGNTVGYPAVHQAVFPRQHIMARISGTFAPSLIDTMNGIRGIKAVVGGIQGDGRFLFVAVGHQPESYPTETFLGTHHTVSQQWVCSFPFSKRRESENGSPTRGCHLCANPSLW